MQDNRTKALEDAFGDAALNLILDEYAGESGAQLLKEYEHAARVSSPKLDALCKKQIYTVFRKKQLCTAAVRCVKAAVLTIACLGVCLTMAMSVEAIRVPVLNFFLERTPRYTQISTQPSGKSESTSVFAALNSERESFTPEGYTLFRAEYGAASFTAVYSNPAGDSANISVFDTHGNLRVDSEDCTETRLTVNGLEAIHWKNNRDPSQSVLLLVPEKEIVCHLYASNMTESDFWDFIYGFAAFL